MKIILFSLIGSFSFFCSSMSYAKNIYFGSERVKLSIPYGEPVIFRFPSNVRTISKAKGLKTSSLDGNNGDYSELQVTGEKRNLETDVSFILAEGKVIKAKIFIKKRSKISDDVYTFIERDTSFDEKIVPVKVNALSLLKTMLKGEKVSEYKIKKESRWIANLHDDLKVKLVETYQGSDFNGHVFMLYNASRYKSYNVTLKDLTLNQSQAVVGQMDRHNLAPKGNKDGEKNFSLVRIVSFSGSQSKEISLPKNLDPIEGGDL